MLCYLIVSLATTYVTTCRIGCHRFIAPYETTVKPVIVEHQEAASPESSPDPPLIAAVKQGDYAGVDALLSKGNDPNTKDDEDIPMLLWAAHRGNDKIAAALIRHGACVNVIHPSYGTALMQAAARGHLETARLLVAQGANISAQGGTGRVLDDDTLYNFLDQPTAMHLAARWKHYSLVEFFLQKGAKVDSVDKSGVTVLMLATYSDPRILHLLLNKGAKVNLRDARGETALFYASRGAGVETMRLLLQHKANPNIANNKGQTPLMMCAGQVANEALTCLLAYKARINAQDKKGQTALHYACQQGDPDAPNRRIEPYAISTARLLLDRGAKVSITDQWHRTPIDCAEESELNDLADFLKKYTPTQGIR